MNDSQRKHTDPALLPCPICGAKAFVGHDVVYVITKGDYSDYHICAVTMDYKRAQTLKKLFTDSFNEARIEKYTPDEVERREAMYYVIFPDDAPPTVHIDEYGYPCAPYVQDWEEPVRVCLRAKDEKHALKIAEDVYAKWKAEREGIV